MKKIPYSPEEIQIILNNYNHSVSMTANAEVIAPMLNNRNAHSLQVKFSDMKRKGLLEAVVKEVVAKEIKIENDFHSRLADLIINHASSELKEKIFISLLAKV